MKKNENNIFTTSFYENECLTLDVLNKLKNPEYIVYFHMCESGEFLIMDIVRNKETESILSEVISDINAYIAYNNEKYYCNEDGISLAALCDAHAKAHKGDYIFWDRECETFYFV